MTPHPGNLKGVTVVAKHDRDALDKVDVPQVTFAISSVLEGA